MNTRQIYCNLGRWNPHCKILKLKTPLGDPVWEVLLKGLYYSVDPYMRGRMNDINLM
jgi:NADPH-dependent curcumin reductase CurA